MATSSTGQEQRRKIVATEAVRQVLSQAPPDGPSEIIDGFLFLGDMEQAFSNDCLSAANITHVVNVTTNERIRPQLDMAIVDGSSLAVPASGGDLGGSREIKRKRLFVCFDDRPNVEISASFPVTNAFIADAAGGHLAPGVRSRVFVHCMAGRSRSATLVAAYLMWAQRLSLRQALILLKERRPMIFPNVGFLQQLRRYEAELFPDAPPSELPLVFEEALSQFGTAAEATPSLAFRRFMAARRALTGSASTEEAEQEEAAGFVLDAARLAFDGWLPGWTGLAVREVLLQSLEELQPSGRREAVALLRLLSTGAVLAPAGGGAIVDGAPLAERRVGSLAEGNSDFTPKLARGEIEEVFRDLQQDKEFRADLKIDNPREGEYLDELEALLGEAGLLRSEAS